ncbi:MAG: DNA mismatch repair protein MutL, partial [Bacteroidota bacterium]
PFFLLFIDIDPHRVDVNVHPSKMEAKFEDEQSIYRFISTLVRRTLSTNDLIPSASVTGGSADNDGFGLRFTQRQHTPFGDYGVDQATMKAPTFEALPHREERTPLFGSGGEMNDRLLRPNDDTTTRQSSQPQSFADAPTYFNPSLVWQVHNKYIIVQIDNGLMVIDQHVAHERVLYERALARFESGMPASQQLLFPRTILLPPSDYALALELESYLGRLGFQIKPFGKNTIAIEGVPPDLKPGAEVQVLQDILGLYKENLQHGVIDVRDNVAKTYSCKAAIKAGDPLSEPEMRSLLDQLFKTKIPYVCPHGRPVVLKISIEELDRRFGRT